MFSNFYQLDLNNKTHVALVNIRWNICRIETQISPNLVMIMGSACLLIS